MIKFCTFFTQTHKTLYKEFMNSFPYEEGVDLIIRYLPQDSDGIYESKTWNKTMYKKMVYIVDYLENLKENEYFIHSDIDIVFYRKFRDDIINLLETSGKEILFQNDALELCMGFFICKKNQNIIDLMKYIRDNLEKFQQDQQALNLLISKTQIKYGVLPQRYYNYGPNNGIQRWDPAIHNFFVPNDIIMHHANWVVGVDNKIKLIKRTREIYKNQKLL